MNLPYRLEWRPVGSVAAAPSLALARTFARLVELRECALALIDADRAAAGEVRVSILRSDGSVAAVVIADRTSLLAWRVDVEVLPEPVTSAWHADDEREAAALEASVVLRRSMNRAVRAGVLDIRQALGMIAHASRLLDRDED